MVILGANNNYKDCKEMTTYKSQYFHKCIIELRSLHDSGCHRNNTLRIAVV